ncbi:Clr5 domain-containing protein [Astrocystis sublimbata]|nr:Clr5 domain-containing protein [Astrocystis sublimbata]
MQPSVSPSESDGAGQVRYAKPSEWAVQKDIIKRLYLDENKTLDEVRRIMADENHFHATPSMYKKRIRAWHFSKKLEEDDVLEVLQQKLERKAAGEASHDLVIRGRVVRNQRLRRFLERRPEVLDRLQAHPDALISVSSPSSSYGVPAEVPRVRALSPESRTMELTMLSVRDYMRECALGPAAWTWTQNGYTSRRIGSTDLRGSRVQMLRAVDEFYCLQASIDDEKPSKEIFKLVNSTLNHLNVAIKAELPDFIFQMIEILQHPWSRHPELSRIFRRHVVELGVVHLGVNHPLSVLWMNMLKENDENSLRLTHNVLEVMLQELLKSKGPQGHLTSVALNYVLRFLIHTQDAYHSWLRFNEWNKAYPDWDDHSKWSAPVRSRLEQYTKSANGSNHPVGHTGTLISPAMEYQRPDGSCGDLHSRYLLPYLAGRIAVRNGDADRAEGWFLKSSVAAKQIPMPHLTDYYPKVYTNLHVLYVATEQREKLTGLHEELAQFKANMSAGTKWPADLLPGDCAECVGLRYQLKIPSSL